jgi:hypothetical protein
VTEQPVEEISNWRGQLAGSDYRICQTINGLETDSWQFVASDPAFATKMMQSDGALSEFETTYL